ncbi:MAG: LacI family DNA-binding transcriptional regulator [Christensenellales bacterium]|uniref:LacI family DNA-binding transcriptional regulator n=1 Tax=Candidatus Avichristensenella intestinipullorum TaxID=2840693 RepID=A0A9D0YXN1_9FIRM|nr:LacI family DNA-binding transcriptional regulator [Christensenellales bacterium]HIQ64004.1 LacI family DNA-binding transcriptional regulator [Candidatus Avichristensenella intestinipullorum]
MKKATSQDVAALAGVSQATVSLILNNSTKITFSNETRERVLAAAQQLNYQLPPRRKARTQAGTTRMLLVLTPTLTNQYYSEIIQTIEEYADSLDYRVIVCNTFRKPELEKFYLNTFVGAHVDGIIYTFLPSFPRLIETISDTLPTVIIGEKHDELSVCSIELRNATAGALLAEHLYQLGHRRLVFISTPFNQLSLARSQRLEGIRRQLEAHGVQDGLEVLSADRSAEADTPEDGLPYEYNVGRALTAELIRRHSRATALIGVNDMTALGILAQLTAQGIRVPGDISVCGFDNIFSSAITTPSLTTIDHHLRTRCQAAVDMVTSRPAPSALPVPFVNKIEYTPQLIVRASTGRARTSGSESPSP